MGQIRDLRLLNIQVILNDKQTIYEGMVEDAPDEIREIDYSKAEIGKLFKIYVYS